LNSTIPRIRTRIPEERDGERQTADENCLEDILDLPDVLLLRIEIPRESAPHTGLECLDLKRFLRNWSHFGDS
jgi:hypothetical protein